MSIREFLPASVGGLVVAALVLLGAPLASRSTTLDPHHRVWQRAGIDHDALWDALRQRRLDQVRPLPSRELRLARGSAVGQRVLVIPVLPRDATVAPVDRATLEARWFGPGEDTVRGYWEWASGGALRLEGRVLPWLQVEGTIAQDYLNIREGSPVSSIVAGPRQLARDALAAASQLVEDLSVFDDDGPDGIAGSGDDDGILDLIVILHPQAGWEVDPVDEGARILSLQTRLCRVQTQTCREIIPGSSMRADAFFVSSATSPLGVWVHEFGHLLGLDDLYDFDRPVIGGTPGTDTQLGGLGRWSLMASGTWGGGGVRPSALDAWSRHRLGWAERVQIEGATSVTLAAIGASGGPQIEVRGFGDWEGERFLLEHRRRREGAVVDGDLPGSGVVVLRVDERAGPIDGPQRWIEVLQADGRDDLGRGADNDGDAGDLFTGATGAARLDGDTNPSTRGASPSPTRIPPVIEIDPPLSGGAHPVRVYASAGTQPVLLHALVRDAARGDRLHMFRGETAIWDLGFADVGETYSGQVELSAQVRPGTRPASLTDEGPLALVFSDGVWSTTTRFEVRDLGAIGDRRPIVVDLFVSVAGGEQRSFELGLPVAFAPGLPADALVDFSPVVLGAGIDTTTFAPLGIEDLPRTAAVGWGLRTNGERRYANDAHVALEGPWFAVPTTRRFSMWSRHLTEESTPGLVYDAGIVELWIPDRGWRELAPEGPGVVQVLRASSAPVRDREAFGGDATFWEPYVVRTGAVQVPTRLRLRFGADDRQERQNLPGLVGWWEVAGLSSDRPLPSATLTVRLAPDGSLQAVVRLSGDVTALDQVRFRYREPGNAQWQVASGLLGLRDEGTTIARIEVPETVRVFEVGLFAEIAGGGAGSTPPLLLGSAGFRRSEPLALPRLMENPIRERMILQVPVRDVPVELRIFDLRGREVALLEIPAGIDWFEWVPRGKSGFELASGRYFLTLGDAPGASLSFSWIR